MNGSLNSIRLAILVPEPSEMGGSVEVRPIIDGHDIVANAFEAGPAHEPEALLRPGGPLRATGEPQEVELTEARCTVGCCGALYVTIHRDDGTVIWDQWRDPENQALDLPPLRFDADQYDAEVARAEQDHSWEWPARTVARLLADRLHAEPERLARWQCELNWVSAWSWERERAIIAFWHPGRPAGNQPWLQFRMQLAVTNDDPAAQAARFADELTVTDPRTRAQVCGGSQEYARQFGYQWPPPRQRGARQGRPGSRSQE